MDSALSGTGVQPQDAAQVWQEVLDQLRTRVSREGFDTWLAPTRGVRIGSTEIEVQVPNSFSADWIGQHYSAEIASALAAATGRALALMLSPAGQPATASRREPRERPAARSDGYRLQPRYTFDAFVVGEQNRLAAAAARSVAERPASNYNPLFIYGGVGLGKTHLIQAIGNQALTLRPAARIYYTAAENLFIELIQAIEKNTRLEFKNKYRGLDLLLLDDVHYLIGKERLQEEVFYIFNNLHDTGSQIVFTSDRPPQDIPTLESRLASRLGSGLVVDIQPPDVETRLAILARKAAAEHFQLPDDVALYVAARVRSSIRELEGCLIRLSALSSLEGRPLTVELAAEALKDLIREEEPLSPKRIMTACSDAFGVPVPDMAGQSRTKQIALARQTAMYLMRTRLNLSLNEVGFHFGDRDHTTVMHAVGKVTQLRAQDPAFASRLDKLTKGISRGEAG